MDLESLKQALEEAKAKAEANPEDKEAQEALSQAQAAYDQALADSQNSPGENDDIDDSSIQDEKLKKYIAKLRKENASHRTKSKDLASKVKAEQERVKAILKAAGIEDDTASPEDQLEVAKTEKHSLQFQAAVLRSALKNGIPEDQVEYFEFLVTKAASSLDEGEELSDEDLAGIVLKVKKAGKGAANSSVGTGNGNAGGAAPKPGQSGQITLERFCGMTILEKSKLYETNQSLYTELMQQARSKKKLV